MGLGLGPASGRWNAALLWTRGVHALGGPGASGGEYSTIACWVQQGGLARAVGLSAPTVAERVKRLEEAGVITGYSAQISPSALGLSISAWLRVRPVPGELERVAKIIQSIPEISECDRITGDDCFLARAHLASVADLERLIERIIPYAMTNTSIIQSSPVPRRVSRFLEMIGD